jgi:hypothetical protein
MGQGLLVLKHRAFFDVIAGPAVVAPRRLHETQSL